MHSYTFVYVHVLFIFLSTLIITIRAIISYCTVTPPVVSLLMNCYTIQYITNVVLLLPKVVLY